jgi:cytochrome b561
MPSFDRYTRTAMALHWLIAAVVVAQFAWGWSMQEIPKQPPGLRADAFNLHKSIGLTILLLMMVRLGWRALHPPPPLPPMPAWQARLAHANHALLYGALFVMPIAGYLGSAWSGYPVKYFGWTLPSWAAKHPELKDLCSTVHFASSWVLLAAVALHVAAAAKHAIVDRDGVLQRMLPRRWSIGSDSILRSGRRMEKPGREYRL